MGNLVISRNPGERVYLRFRDIEIEVCVVAIKDGQSQIAIRAPEEVQIDRPDAQDHGPIVGWERKKS